jgi:hypothetical protein
MAGFNFAPVFSFREFLQRRRRERNTSPPDQPVQPSQPLLDQEPTASKDDASLNQEIIDSKDDVLLDKEIADSKDDTLLNQEIADSEDDALLNQETNDSKDNASLNQEITASTEDALRNENDGESILTMPPPYSQAPTTSEDAVVCNESLSGMPCVCGSHQGCCHKHNSIRSPNRSLLEQPNISRGIARPSALTLAPIHSAMRYHLSLDNLNCIRRKLSSGVTRKFINRLSCEDSATSEKDTSYYWSSEIYFREGTFLQRQEINCYLSQVRESPAEYFTGCPHQSISISKPEFTIKDGMLEVQAWVTNHPPRCASHEREKWSNFQGQYAQMTVCNICHSDAECTLELENNNFHIRYTCYRDLGPGKDPSHPKWLALLTGEGSPHRQEYGLELYAHVWRTAMILGRGHLHQVTHRTPKGLFRINSLRY